TRTAADRIDDDRVARRLGRMGLSPEKIELFRSFHEGAPPWRLLGQASTDTVFRVPAVRFSDARSGAEAGTWLYDFRWKTEVLEMGAVHCLDVPFAFDVLDHPTARAITGDDPPQELADEVHRAWVGFIKDGDPGWPKYETDKRPTKVFDVESRVDEDPWEDLRETWID
ncbi:MAG: carboxylesterase family protein, partial [Acidimicrobiia bacterium]